MFNRVFEEDVSRFRAVLTGLFAATLLISNVLNCKVIRVGALAVTGGLIMFPLASLLGDVLTEVYGYAESLKVIWTGLGSLVLFAVMIEICGALPADPLSTPSGGLRCHPWWGWSQGSSRRH